MVYTSRTLIGCRKPRECRSLFITIILLALKRRLSDSKNMASGWWMIMRQSPPWVKYHDLDLPTMDSVHCVLFPGYQAKYFQDCGLSLAVLHQSALVSMRYSEHKVTNDNSISREERQSRNLGLLIWFCYYSSFSFLAMID